MRPTMNRQPMQIADVLLERLPIVSYLLGGRAAVRNRLREPAGRECSASRRTSSPRTITRGRAASITRPAAVRQAIAGLQFDADRMSVEYRLSSEDGEAVWVSDIASYDGGTICGYLTDITREKELEHQLAVERATLDAFFTQSSVALGITDSNGRYVRLNEALATLSGGDSPRAFIGRTLADVSPGVAAIADPHRVGVDAPREFTVDTDTIHALARYFPFTVDGERYHGRIVVDLTEQRRAEEGERHFRSLIERLPLVVYVNDVEPQRIVRYISAADRGADRIHRRGVHGRPAARRPDHPSRRHRRHRRAREQASPDVFEHEYRIVRARRRGALGARPDGAVSATPTGSRSIEQGFLVDVTESARDRDALPRASGTARSTVSSSSTPKAATSISTPPPAASSAGRTTRCSGGTSTTCSGRARLPRTARRACRAASTCSSGPTGGTGRRVGGQGERHRPGVHFAVLRDVTRPRAGSRPSSGARRSSRASPGLQAASRTTSTISLTAIRGYAQLLQARVAPGSVEHHHARSRSTAPPTARPRSPRSCSRSAAARRSRRVRSISTG